MNAVLDKVMAVASDSVDGALGFVVWFSVPDRPVSLNLLRRLWLTHGLEQSVLPNDPRSLYLFKRAVRGQEGKEKHNGNMVQTDVQPVLENGELCVYQISRVVRDLDDQVVDYPKAMRVVYDKARGEIVAFDRLGEESKHDLQPMIDSIEHYMEANTKMVDGRKVRTLIRNYLKDNPLPDPEGGKLLVGLGGTNLRGKAGGVYFVAVEYDKQLKDVAAVLSKLYESEGENYGLCAFPLADDKKARDMVRDAHVANTVKEIEEALVDAKKLLREGRKNAVRSDVIQFHAARLKGIRRRSAEYNALLREEQDEVAQKATILGKQLEALVGAGA